MNPDAVAKFIASLGESFHSSDPSASSHELERENVTILQRVYQALTISDYAAIGALLTDDVELEIIGPAVMPFLGKWHGIPQVLEAIQRNFAFVRNQRPEIVNLNVKENSIVVVAREQGEAVSTGKPYDIHWVQIFTFRDGKMARIHEVADGLDLALAFNG